jgi:hypothetical protein
LILALRDIVNILRQAQLGSGCLYDVEIVIAIGAASIAGFVRSHPLRTHGRRDGDVKWVAIKVTTSSTFTFRRVSGEKG